MTAENSKPGPDGGQGGQSYLASVSDLVSALIFVFIIMLAIFAFQLASVTQGLTAANETRDRILRDIANRLEESGIRVEVVSDQGVLRLSDNAINFPSGSETPNAAHHANVGRLAHAIAEVVPCFVSGERPSPTLARDVSPADDLPEGGGSAPYCQPLADPEAYPCTRTEFIWHLGTLLIEGHTDDVPVAVGNRFRDNIELSSIRAATVHRMIGACEPRVERLLNTDNHPILSTSGYGPTRPATDDPNRVDENRRIDLRFLMEPPKGVFRSKPSVQTEVGSQLGEGRR